MKNLILTFGVLAMLISSCNNKSDDNKGPNPCKCDRELQKEKDGEEVDQDFIDECDEAKENDEDFECTKKDRKKRDKKYERNRRTRSY